MIHVIALITAKPGQRDTVLEAFRGNVAAVRAEEGCIEYGAAVNAKERLRLAERRYQTGVGSLIDLGDAQVAQTTAAAQLVQAEFTLSTARAQLVRALGREVPRG